MGVKACARTDCTQVLCDHLIRVRDVEYYVCRRCREDLEAARRTWPTPMTVADLHARLTAFLESSASLRDAGRVLDGPAAVEAEIERLTRDVHHDYD